MKTLSCRLANYKMLTERKLSVTPLGRIPYFDNIFNPFPLIWKSLLCHKSPSVSISLETIRATWFMETSLKRKSPLIFKRTRTTLQSFNISNLSVEPLYSQPIESSIPREIRFLFKYGTCLTFLKSVVVSSLNLSVIDPMPTILQALSFLRYTRPPFHTLYIVNYPFNSVVWNEHPGSSTQ